MPKRFFNILRDCAMGKPPGKPRRLSILPVAGVFAFPRRGRFLLKCFSNLIFFRAYAARACTCFLCRQKAGKELPKGKAFRFAFPFGNPIPTDQGGGCGPLAWTRPGGANEIAGAIWMAHIYVPTAPAAAVGNAVRRPSCTKPAEALFRAALFGIEARFCSLLHPTPLFLCTAPAARFFFSSREKKKWGAGFVLLLQNKTRLENPLAEAWHFLLRPREKIGAVSVPIAE